MQTHTVTRTDAESPFFSLLSEADHVQVREIGLESKDRILSNLEKTLKDFASQDNGSVIRTFFVHVRMPAPKPPPSECADEEGYERESLNKSAGLLLENGEYILARNIFSYLLKDGIRDVPAMRGLGICLFRLGEIVSAKKCFMALCELQSTVDCWFWMGQCHLAEANDAAAAECFQQVGVLDKDLQFELFKNWGNCLTRLGKNQEAADLYEQALQINPDSDVLLVNLGTLSLQRSEFPAAENWFRRALEANPKSSKAHCGLGLVSVQAGQFQQAQDWLQAALDLDSQNIVALHQLVLVSQGPLPNIQIKQRLVQFLVREPRNAEVHYALAVLLFKEGAWKECEAHADQALENDPNHRRALDLKGELTQLKR